MSSKPCEVPVVEKKLCCRKGNKAIHSCEYRPILVTIDNGCIQVRNRSGRLLYKMARGNGAVGERLENHGGMVAS